MSCYPADSGTCAANGASTARRGRAQAPRPALALLALMMALAPFGDTEYTPAMPAIAHALGADYGMVQLTVVFAGVQGDRAPATLGPVPLCGVAAG